MKRYIVWILCLGCLMVSVQCASSNKTKKQSADKQSEEDVLKLLGISQNEQKSENTAPAPSAVATLEQQVRQKDAEINQLKSELTLKDEKIAELEKGRTQISAAPLTMGDYTSQYEVALGLYRSGRYQDALTGFHALLAQSMTNSLSDNCQYWIGECYYDMRNYRQAIVEFEKVFTFPQSNKDPDAQLKLGLCYQNMGDAAKAREEFNRIITNYPKSSYVARAHSYLARLKN